MENQNLNDFVVYLLGMGAGVFLFWIWRQEMTREEIIKFQEICAERDRYRAALQEISDAVPVGVNLPQGFLISVEWAFEVQRMVRKCLGEK